MNSMPDPFGMRWFGIWAASLLIQAAVMYSGAADSIPMLRLLVLLPFVSVVFMIGLSELHRPIQRWLLGHWV